jgi:hypothetical protein
MQGGGGGKGKIVAMVSVLRKVRKDFSHFQARVTTDVTRNVCTKKIVNCVGSQIDTLGCFQGRPHSL